MADPGIWAVAGAAIGSLGSALTTWLNARLGRDKNVAKYDQAAMELLKDYLDKNRNWQPISSLANLIGLDHRQTQEYLIMLGARGNERDGKLWALKIHKPLRKRDEAEDR